jgi:hypothetical protein
MLTDQNITVLNSKIATGCFLTSYHYQVGCTGKEENIIPV